MAYVKLKDIVKDINGLDKSLELELTNFCNAKCGMCPREELNRPKGYMTLKTLKAILNASAQFQINNISIGGFGEPLLHKDFRLLIKTMRSVLPNAKISLTTNGLLLAPEMQNEIIKAGISEINVSFHSNSKDEYENFMGISYLSVIDNVKSFLKNHPQHENTIRIGIVRTKLNTDKVENIINFWDKIGVKNFTILTAHNRAGKLMDQAIADNQFFQEQRIEIQEKDKSICRTASIILKFVDWQGKTHLCCNDLDSIALLGDLQVDSFETIESNRENIWKKAQKELCRNCNMPSTLLHTELISI